MAKKKDDKPYMPFYIGDWFKAPEIRALPHEYRMVWFEILCLMWQGDEKGFLTIKGRPFVITDDITGEITTGEHVLSAMLGVKEDFLQKAFKKLKEFEVFKVRDDGAIYSGFMVKLVDKKRVKSTAGKKGMEVRYKKSVITTDITKCESEYIDLILEFYAAEKILNGEPPAEKKEIAMVVLEMLKVWSDSRPGYSHMKEVDYPALLKIAYLIAAKKGWTEHSVTNFRQRDVIGSWSKIVAFLADDKTDKFLRRLTLDGIAIPKNFQKVEEAMKDSDFYKRQRQQSMEKDRIKPEDYFTE